MYLEEPLFIVVDGPDGCGKTTLINNLATYLREELNQQVEVMRALGQGRIGMECRTRHLRDQTGPGYESMMMPMSIMEAYYDHVLPALKANKCVLMDRWVASFFAYQVCGREDLYSKEIYETLFDDNRTPLLRQPDIYFMGNVDPAIAQQRLQARSGESNYLDEESLAFKTRVNNGFKKYAQYGKNIIMLDCNNTQAIINAQAQTYIDLCIDRQRKDALITKRKQAEKLAQEAQTQ